MVGVEVLEVKLVMEQEQVDFDIHYNYHNCIHHHSSCIHHSCNPVNHIMR